MVNIDIDWQTILRLKSQTSRSAAGSCLSPIYSVCPATCWCFPSSHKETESPIDAHHAPPLPSPSLFDSHTHAHTSCPIKSCRKKQAAFVLLLWSWADVSEVGSHGWLGATRALVSWHYPAPQMLPSPAVVSACVCAWVCVCVCVCLLYYLSLSKCSCWME